MKKAIKLKIIFATFLILVTGWTFADNSEHQRIGVERKNPLILTPGIAVTFIDSGKTTDESSTVDEALILGETFSVDILYQNKWNFFTSISLRQYLSLDVTQAGTIYSALGDPDIGAGRIFRLHDWKGEVSLRWTFPIGVWDAYEAEAKHICSGSGYHRATLLCSFTRFMDPVALTFSTEIDTTLPRNERFGTSWEPLSISFPTAITWAANSRLGIQARISPSFSFPPELNRTPVYKEISRDMNSSLAITLSGEKNSFGLQSRMDLLDIKAMPSLTFYYSRTITLGEK